MTPLQRHILHTLAPALDADILRDSLTDWLHPDTLARFRRSGVNFRLMFLPQLVEFLSDGTLVISGGTYSGLSAFKGGAPLSRSAPWPKYGGDAQLSGRRGEQR